MNKSELVDLLAENADLPKSDVDKVLKALEDVVTNSVAGKGEKITWPGFLTIERGHRAARTGRNPQTGEAIAIAASNTVKISVGSKLKAAAKAST